MSAIQKIEALLESSRKSLAGYELALQQNPGNVFYEGMVNNTRESIAELTRDLIREKNERNCELIELRLSGKRAHHGTLPLDLLGRLVIAFSDSLHHTSHKIQFGNNKGHHQMTEVKQTLDLRLAGISTGSTRLMISGQTNPDLFGRSLMEESLQSTFNLLQAEDFDKLTDAAVSCGTMGVTKLRTFLTTITNNELELEMNWDTPRFQNISWVGEKRRIQEVSNSLGHFEKSKPIEFPFEAVMITSSLKGNFELRLSDKRTVKGTYPKNLLETVKQIAIGDDCSGILEETRITNPVTLKEKSVFSLKHISPLS